MTSYFVARAHKAVWSQRAFEPSVPSYFVQLSEIKCKRRSRDCQFSFTICCLETTWSFTMTLVMPILCRDDTENNHLYYIGPFCTKKADDKIDVIVNRIVYWALNAFHGLQSNGGNYLPVWIIPKWERLWFDQWFVSVSYDQGQKQSQIQLEVLGHSVRVRWGIKRPRYGSSLLGQIDFIAMDRINLFDVYNVCNINVKTFRIWLKDATLVLPQIDFIATYKYCSSITIYIL